MSIVVVHAACRSDDWPWPGISCLVLFSMDFATFDLGFHLASLSWLGPGGRSASRTCLVGTWSAAQLHELAQQGPGRPVHLAILLGRDLIGRSTSPSRSYSVGTWSVALPRRLAR
jgi:hypothetical protein